jgi:hypothetical protein
VIIYKCDRCKKEEAEKFTTGVLINHKPTDLCFKCHQEYQMILKAADKIHDEILLAWLEGGK